MLTGWERSTWKTASTFPKWTSTANTWTTPLDDTKVSAEFKWLSGPCQICNGAGCSACSPTTQDGCLQVRDHDSGFVSLMPATYDADNACWSEQSWSVGRDPDSVRVWYQAGEISREFRFGHTCDPLSQSLAEAIAWLAIARLEMPLCNCSHVKRKVDYLQTPLDQADPDGPDYTLSEDDLTNPFGTRRGEIRAWRRVSRLHRARANYATL